MVHTTNHFKGTSVHHGRYVKVVVVNLLSQIPNQIFYFLTEYRHEWLQYLHIERSIQDLSMRFPNFHWKK